MIPANLSRDRGNINVFYEPPVILILLCLQDGFSPQVHFIAAWDPSTITPLVADRLFCRRTGTYVPYSYEQHNPSIGNLLSIKVSYISILVALYIEDTVRYSSFRVNSSLWTVQQPRSRRFVSQRLQAGHKHSSSSSSRHHAGKASSTDAVPHPRSNSSSAVCKLEQILFLSCSFSCDFVV